MKTLTTFKFVVDDKTFNIFARNIVSAMELANFKVRSEKMVKLDDSFAWFDGAQKNSLWLGHNVNMN